MKLRIYAGDDDAGKLRDLYLDEQNWTIRYLVADMGGWIKNHRVLIAPIALGQPMWQEHRLPVNLTKQQISSGPTLEENAPVSRQYEIYLGNFFGWPSYWIPNTDPNRIPPMRPADPVQDPQAAEPHLRSANELKGYAIHATDGDVGHVDDLLIEPGNWIARYFIVDTRNWLPGKKVLIGTHWIEEISWPEHRVSVDLRREQIKSCPEFDPDNPPDRAYEEHVHVHYDKPPYWDREDQP